LISFRTIRARAEKRKGGAERLNQLLPARPKPEALRKLKDDRALAEMTKRVFSAGFAWSVIESKWPGFEEAFLGFVPAQLTFQPDDFWDKLTTNARIVRNGAKIMSVRSNARFVEEIAKEHGSFGKFLAAWPSADEVGLLDLLAKRGDRLGGATGQMLLRVFSLLVELRNYDEWLPRSSAFRGTSEIFPGPIAVGTTYVERGPLGVRHGIVTHIVRPTELDFEQP
jgi:3-methyladenine DNA glycosylase Tag